MEERSVAATAYESSRYGGAEWRGWGGARLPAGFRMTPSLATTNDDDDNYDDAAAAAAVVLLFACRRRRTAKALSALHHANALHLRHRPARFTKRAPTCRRVRAVYARHWPHSRSVYYYTFCTHKITPRRFNSSSALIYIYHKTGRATTILHFFPSIGPLHIILCSFTRI